MLALSDISARAFRRDFSIPTTSGCAPPSTRRAIRAVSSSVVTASLRSSSVASSSQTLFLIWLVLGIGGLLTLVALCIAPCVTPALFPDDDDAEDDPEKKYGEDREEAKERESVSSEGSAAPAGDEPATWHGSSVEVDDLWPGTTAPAQEVPPRSLEL